MVISFVFMNSKSLVSGATSPSATPTVSSDNDETSKLKKMKPHVPGIVIFADHSRPLPWSVTYHAVTLFADVSGTFYRSLLNQKDFFVFKVKFIFLKMQGQNLIDCFQRLTEIGIANELALLQNACIFIHTFIKGSFKKK